MMVGRTHAGATATSASSRRSHRGTNVRRVGEDVATRAKLFPSRPESHFLGSSGTHRKFAFTLSSERRQVSVGKAAFEEVQRAVFSFPRAVHAGAL